jgi:hypothetical protein
MLLIVFMCTLFSYAASFKFSIPKLPSKFRVVHAYNLPDEISSTDIRSLPDVVYLSPNIDIHELDGGSFLGVMLWTYVVYNGIFGKIGRPADWVLPIIANAFNMQDEEWFKNFKGGYDYFPPPQVELLRVCFFALLGFAVNTLCIQSFDGDVFWGWSTGICLAMPSALISISRDKLLSREKSEFQVL